MSALVHDLLPRARGAVPNQSSCMPHLNGSTTHRPPVSPGNTERRAFSRRGICKILHRGQLAPIAPRALTHGDEEIGSGVVRTRSILGSSACLQLSDGRT